MGQDGQKIDSACGQPYQGAYRSIVAGPSITVSPSAQEARKTVCVLGAPRGGTSMVAGLLHKMGVPMGDLLDPANIEDRAFLGHGGVREIFTRWRRTRERAAYLAGLRRLIAEKNKKDPVWGWKDPLSSYYVKAVSPALINPRYIFVTRDLNAIAGREQLEEGMFYAQTVFDYLENALDQYRTTIRFLRAAGRPTLLVSYERALRAPAELATSLARFLGLDISEATRAWAEAYVAADRGDAGIDQAGLNARRSSARVVSENLYRLFEDGLQHMSETQLGEQFNSEEQRCQAGQNYVVLAVDALAAGQALECRQNCLAVLQLHARQKPALRDGLLGLTADLLISPCAGSVYPPIVCRCVYLIGRSYLMEGDASRALAYLQTAARLMRARSRCSVAGGGDPPQPYWECLLHAALAAQAIERNDIVHEVREIFVTEEMRSRTAPQAANADFTAALAQIRAAFDSA